MAAAVRCTVALRQHGHSASWLQALQLLERMQRKGPRPNVISYNATLNVLAKARRWEEAIHVLQDCCARGMADTRSYNATLESIRTHQQAESLSLELLAQMQRHRIQQSVVTLGTLVAASAANWRRCLSLVQQAQEQSISPNTVVCNSLITACEKGSQWPRSLVFLQSLTSPTVVSYNACISACSRDQQSRLALQLFDEMSSMRVPPTLVTYNALIHAHARSSHGSHVDKITAFIQQMKDQSLQADTITMNGLLSALEKRYKWREALHAAFRLPILRDVISFNALISSCEKGQ